jgi:hypothetical protein
MPELLRSIASRLRGFVADRRRAPRHAVRLSAFASLLDATPGAPPSAGLAGHTRDVSDSGLGLLLPAVHVGGRYLVGEGVTLRITLKLPTSSARLYGTPVRYERLEEQGQTDPVFLVGVRLDDTGDRAAFADYLKNFKGNK